MNQRLLQILLTINLSLVSILWQNSLFCAAEPFLHSNELTKSCAEFGVSLYKALEPSENTVFSPYSIFSCLSMLYVGADGTTKESIGAALHITHLNKDFFSSSKALHQSLFSKEKGISINNGIWMNEGSFFLPTFLDQVQSYFFSEPNHLDFAKPSIACHTINSWVKEKTFGKIPNLFLEGDINKNTNLVIVNTVYCQMNWKTPFPVNNTLPSPFYGQKEEYTVPMMQNLKYYDYLEQNDLQIVALASKAKSQDLLFLVLLPKGDLKLNSLENTLCQERIETWLKRLTNTYLNLRLPKFTMKARIDLKDVLERIGIVDAFSERANFSKINGKHNLYIHKMIHEVFFEVDEIGLTAAAATGATMSRRSILPTETRPISFIANRPFMFVVVDAKTHTLLFLGKYEGPL